MSAEYEQTALGLYVVMARDWSDALDLIRECQDKATLEMLLVMLTTDAPDEDNRKLNELFVKPVERQIARIS